MTMTVNSLGKSSADMPTYLEIEPFIPSWFHDNGCSIPGPRWLWALLFGWSDYYEMSRICRVHDALYYLAFLEGWEFSWMDKEEKDHVLWEGCCMYGISKWKRKLVTWGLNTKIAEEIYERLRDESQIVDKTWKRYIYRKKQQLGISKITGWE